MSWQGFTSGLYLGVKGTHPTYNVLDFVFLSSPLWVYRFLCTVKPIIPILTTFSTLVNYGMGWGYIHTRVLHVLKVNHFLLQGNTNKHLANKEVCV